jgi:hypothetical protein
MNSCMQSTGFSCTQSGHFSVLHPRLNGADGGALFENEFWLPSAHRRRSRSSDLHTSTRSRSSTYDTSWVHARGDSAGLVTRDRSIICTRVGWEPGMHSRIGLWLGIIDHESRKSVSPTFESPTPAGARRNGNSSNSDSCRETPTAERRDPADGRNPTAAPHTTSTT